MRKKSMREDNAGDMTVGDDELKRVICDFLEMGHAENIVSMFRRNPDYYRFSGDILQDGRFNVRLGLTIVFEELQKVQSEEMYRAIPSLKSLLTNESPLLRGEAAGLLGTINTTEARRLIMTLKTDESPQVRELVQLITTDNQ